MVSSLLELLGGGSLRGRGVLTPDVTFILQAFLNSGHCVAASSVIGVIVLQVSAGSVKSVLVILVSEAIRWCVDISLMDH